MVVNKIKSTMERKVCKEDAVVEEFMLEVGSKNPNAKVSACAVHLLGKHVRILFDPRTQKLPVKCRCF